MEDFSFHLAMVVVAVYSVVSQICAAYFLYLIAQSHEFAYALFIGPFIAEFKGLLWPFFI
jgi:hypothetical protein